MILKCKWLSTGDPWRCRPRYRRVGLHAAPADADVHETSVFGAPGVPRNPGAHGRVDAFQLAKSRRSPGAQLDGNAIDVAKARVLSGYVSVSSITPFIDSVMTSDVLWRPSGRSCRR
jgi:hypothetical protein